MTKPLLQLDHVSKEFKAKSRSNKVEALTDVSLSVSLGEILGLIGQSGSGKTTTGLLSVRLLDATSGAVIFDEEDITTNRGASLRRRRAGFQMIQQDPYQSLNPRIKVGRLLSEPLRIHAHELSRDERLERVQHTLERVGLSPGHLFEDRFAHELSGGQRQRVAIGRAIIANPRFLVWDEPVSMLDVSVRAGILRLLLALRESLGISHLFITHDVGVAKQVCDRLAVMLGGRIVEMGNAEQVLSNPSHSYTKKLIEAVPSLERAGQVLLEGD
jgi:peptide/nickel transport system ATP-binding protein